MINPRVGVPGVQPRSYPVPARKILPQAYEMFALLVSGSRSNMLSRPPWGCVATPSLALDYLGVSPQVLWSYTIRRQGPEVESDAKRLYRNVGRRNLYRYESVLAWLPGGGDRPPGTGPVAGSTRSVRAWPTTPTPCSPSSSAWSVIPS